jgi:hypothetical protein
MLSIALITTAAAAPPAADPPAADPPAQAPAGAQVPQGTAPPDDSFLEFLGSDDVGDARWWDYLLKTAPRAPPPQTAAQGTNK